MEIISNRVAPNIVFWGRVGGNLFIGKTELHLYIEYNLNTIKLHKGLKGWVPWALKYTCL